MVNEEATCQVTIADMTFNRSHKGDFSYSFEKCARAGKLSQIWVRTPMRGSNLNPAREASAGLDYDVHLVIYGACWI